MVMLYFFFIVDTVSCLTKSVDALLSVVDFLPISRIIAKIIIIPLDYVSQVGQDLNTGHESRSKRRLARRHCGQHGTAVGAVAVCLVFSQVLLAADILFGDSRLRSNFDHLIVDPGVKVLSLEHFLAGRAAVIFR